MTEKQRWLLRDLETWEKRQLEKIGRYGPPKVRKDPPHVRAAKQAQRRAEAVLAQWDRDKKAPWEHARDAIYKRRDAVKRIILFERTEAALKALRCLDEPPSSPRSRKN